MPVPQPPPPPEKRTCCGPGEYSCQVPMPINGRRQDIDICIADLVAALNAANITTVASCCGHGRQEGSIVLEDGRELIIKNVLAIDSERGRIEVR